MTKNSDDGKHAMLFVFTDLYKLVNGLKNVKKYLVYYSQVTLCLTLGFNSQPAYVHTCTV